MSSLGSLLFAKYAFAPNKLRYCGPGENRAIFDYCVAQQSDRGLIELLKGFEGAYPYLQLVAKANKIKDPFDLRVVEAYWIGNDLLKNVSAKTFYDSIKNRFGKKIPPNSIKWLLTKPPIGAKPHHSFHVLDVYTKTGLIRSGMSTPILETINNCLILPGKVTKISNFQSSIFNKLSIINYQLSIQFHPIILINGKLTFGKLTTKEVISMFISPQKGDIVNFHWGNVCDILTPCQLKNLQAWTRYHMEIANKTI